MAIIRALNWRGEDRNPMEAAWQWRGYRRWSEWRNWEFRKVLLTMTSLKQSPQE